MKACQFSQSEQLTKLQHHYRQSQFHTIKAKDSANQSRALLSHPTIKVLLQEVKWLGAKPVTFLTSRTATTDNKATMWAEPILHLSYLEVAGTQSRFSQPEGRRFKTQICLQFFFPSQEYNILKGQEDSVKIQPIRAEQVQLQLPQSVWYKKKSTK